MSQHPSLKLSSIETQHRNVLKRYERVKHLIEKAKWKDEDSVFGLPKIKRIRLKIKKEKAAETAKPGTETTSVPGQAEAKPQEAVQPAASKEKKPK
jgi:small basic protein (TIGR04137 family)